MRHSTKLLSLAVLSATFSTALAEDAPSTADVRCLIVGMSLSVLTDPKQRAAGQIATYYFVGRLNSVPVNDLEDSIFKESTTMTPADLKSEAVRCGKDLTEKGLAIQQMGINLMHRAKEMTDKQTAAPAVPPNTALPSDEGKPKE